MKKVAFTKREIAYLSRNEICRVATCRDNIPHVVPVSYTFRGAKFYFATDYGTTKLKNLKANDRLALVVDTYDEELNQAVCVQGRTRVIEKGPEYVDLYKLFYTKFDWVRENPWKPGEAPFIEVVPSNKVSWGIS